ncbi:MAG TPA: ABC transporter ATP-binding protein [Anaerolineales bacterium]|jgi:branched-chain amino acid transport system ATP-binding protein
MLQVKGVDVYYGDVQVLKGVTMDVQDKELVAVIGANGAGKTTLMKTISGLIKPRKGSIYFNDKCISDIPGHQVVRQGVVQVPEGRLLFQDMSVLENLQMGAFQLRDKNTINAHLMMVYEMFPILKEREKQLAGTLSGGEQQMVAIGRALMSSPKMIMFDEPSLGLSPKLVSSIFEMIVRINKELGITVLLVEQNVQHSCHICGRAFVVENGEVVLSGPGSEMLKNEHVRKAYLGL